MRTDEYKPLHGKHVAIFGPNFIWSGLLAEETETTLVLHDVSQVYNTGAHNEVKAEREYMSPLQIFPKTSICNIGTTKWATPLKASK